MGRRTGRDVTGTTPADPIVKPKNLRRAAGEKKPSKHEALERRVHHLFRELETLMSTAADLQTQVDALKANVAALQAAPKPTPLITQAQLDANTADVSAANDALKVLAAPPPTA